LAFGAWCHCPLGLATIRVAINVRFLFFMFSGRNGSLGRKKQPIRTCLMWFKVEDTRSSTGQRFIVRCTSEIAGSNLSEERPVQGIAAARKAAELLASSLNMTATVYGKDGDGEFVFGVWEVTQSAEEAQSPMIKRLFAESAASSLALKDRLLADIPEDTIKGFATMAAALGYLVAHHKEVKRAANLKSATRPFIRYSVVPASRRHCRSMPTTQRLGCCVGSSPKCRAGWSLPNSAASAARIAASSCQA
jgi:hypothetical protein